MMRAGILVGLVFAVGLGAGWMLNRAGHDANSDTKPGNETAVFRCPMHPWVTATAPADCTVCGMDLVRNDAPDPMPEMCGLPAPVKLGPAVAAVAGVKTTPVAHQPLVRTLRVAGTIEVDAARRHTLTAWVDGRVDRLFVNTVGAEIREGEPLLTLFSRDLEQLQDDFLQLARVGANGASALAEQRTRLRQAGMTGKQIEELLVARESAWTSVIMAPRSGTVITQEVDEGQWVRTGDRLFEIADFSRLWFVFELSAVDRPWVRVGTPLEIVADGTTLAAAVIFIDPNSNPATRAAVARAEFANPGGWRRGAFAEGRLRVEQEGVLAVPRSAVLDGGAGPVAWVEHGMDAYEPRPLQLGRCGDTLVEVLAGLAEGERVVVAGGLILDAQAEIERPLPTAAARTEGEK